MKHGLKIILLCVQIIIVSKVSAQTVTESWLRQAGITCGAGLSVEMQGELGAAIFRRLKAGTIEGGGSFSKSHTEALLNQFKEDETREAYINYINCLTSIMNSATNTSSLPPKDVVLDSPIAVANLEAVKRGQRFVLLPGDSIAVKDYSLIFTLQYMRDYQKKSFIYFTWSNSQTEQQATSHVYQSQLIKFGEKCNITPYKVDVENNQVSFLSNC